LEETLKVRVVAKTDEAERVCRLVLESSNGQILPAFEAGAHIDLHVNGDMIRQYSLCGDPHDRTHYSIGVLRDQNSRGGSSAIHDRLHVGDHLHISVPRNHFHLHEAAAYSILFAGGIGITPLLAMSRRLFEIRAPFELHYCCRKREDAAFLGDLSKIVAPDRLQLHFDNADHDQLLTPSLVIAGAPKSTHFYVCGPTGFMEWILAHLETGAIAGGCVHREYFSNDLSGHATSGEFSIVLAKSNMRFSIPAERSIADVLQDNGVNVPVSCMQGICGTCVTRVLSGVPDHRDVYLTAEEHSTNSQITLCCSRSLSKELVLDL
jgi:vanillate monooxygenase ferredoxin subunit